MLLARAGVGYVRLIDRDFVEESNLQRQFLYTEDDARTVQPKGGRRAARALRLINSQIDIEGLVSTTSTRRPSSGCSATVDLVLDATDNFDARYLLNDYAVKTGTPWVYGALRGLVRHHLHHPARRDACLRCLFETPRRRARPKLRHGRRARLPSSASSPRCRPSRRSSSRPAGASA